MLCAFVDSACGPGMGVAWATADRVFPLRAPSVGPDGLRDFAAFQWSPAPPPPPKPPVGFWQRLKAGIVWCIDQEGKAALQEAQNNQMMAEGMNQLLSKMVHSHQDDGAGVLFDILAVGLSLVLLPTGVGALAAVALLGGTFLLYADGRAYAMELAGDEEQAEAFKKATEKYRLLATLATLADVGWNGVKLIKELRELKEMRELDEATQVAAQGMAKRTANADRAQRFSQIAERAHLRAQRRTRNIFLKMHFDPPSKVSGTAGSVLFVREEYLNDESIAHQIARRLQVHCTSVHK